jgi:CBS domain containing-hemolysin-like protein
LAALVAPALQLFYRISLPFVVVIERSAAAITQAMKVQDSGHGGGHSAEELKLIVTSSRGMGYLPEAQEDIIHRVLGMADIAVREVMVPRNDVVAIPLTATLDEVLRTMLRQKHSRLPVFEENMEKIVGILHYKDLLPLWEERRRANRTGRPSRPFRIKRVLRKHLIVPESKPLSQMLDEFRQAHSHMAMVVDEYGTIVGLLTVEDVLERMVGRIEDEHDEKAAERHPEDATMELDGATKIRDLDSNYGIDVPTDAGFETLAGFLLFRLGAIPQAGQSVTHEGHKFTVTEMEHNRIARVRIERDQSE